MSRVSVEDLGDDVPLSCLLSQQHTATVSEDRAILLQGGLAQACKRVLQQSTQQINCRAERLKRTRHQLYLQQCEDHSKTVVYPVEFRSREWCVDFAIARETRDFAVRHGHLTQHDAHAIALAHGNPGTPVQAPSGHRIILAGAPSSSEQLRAAAQVYLHAISQHRGEHKAQRVFKQICRGVHRGRIEDNGNCWSP